MCDTLVAVPPATADGAVWFAKNSDREPGEAQAVEVVDGDDGSPVLLSRPAWMRGAEMGANAHGLAIGNEAVFTRFPVPGTGLTGMDLLRTALEEARTAVEALELIIERAGHNGQGGRCGYRARRFRYFSSFIIADPREAWVLETAGPYWAAERVRGVRTLSNTLSIGDAFDRIHPEAYTFARRKGWCGSATDFNFARCFGDPWYRRLTGGPVRQACTLRRLRDAEGRVDRDTMMAALRDHAGRSPHLGVLMHAPCAHAHWSPAKHAGQTTGSMVSRLHTDGPHHWLTGTSSPCLSVFKPVLLEAGTTGLGPPASVEYHEASLFWRHERLHRRVLPAYDERRAAFEADRAAFEGRVLAGGKDSVRAGQDAWHEHAALIPEWIDQVERTGGTASAPALYQAWWRRQSRRDGMPE
jgi:secernin